MNNGVPDEVQETRSRMCDDLVGFGSLVICIPLDPDKDSFVGIPHESNSAHLADALGRLLFISDQTYGEMSRRLAAAMDRPIVKVRQAIEEIATNYRDANK